MWRAVVTVLWTTKISQPASTAIGANRFALAGVHDTATVTPSAFICFTRSAISSRLDGFGVELLQARRDVVLGRARNLFEQRRRVFVTGVDAFKVQNSKAAEAAELTREVGVDNGVERRGHDRHRERMVPDLAARRL